MIPSKITKNIADKLLLIYSTTSNAELAELFGVTVETVSSWAGRNKLRKTAEHWCACQSKRMRERAISQETRAKLRAARIGKKMSPEVLAAMLLKRAATHAANGYSQVGERNHNWKGGRPWKRFRDPAYRAWREAVLKRDGYQCQDCQRQCGKHESGLAAHHVKPYASHPDLRLEVSNGLTLCRECHMAVHGRSRKPQDPIPCACGCGEMILPVTRYGQPRRYVNGHSRRKASKARDTHSGEASLGGG